MPRLVCFGRLAAAGYDPVRARQLNQVLRILNIFDIANELR
jgi:hypothetical protein